MLQEGCAVDIVRGTYAKKRGRIVSLTDCKVRIQVRPEDGGAEVQINRTSVKLSQLSASESDAVLNTHVEKPGMRVGSHVKIEHGKYKGRHGQILKMSTCMADVSCDGDRLCVRQTSLSPCSAESCEFSTRTGSAGSIATTADLDSQWEALSDDSNKEELETQSSASVSKGELVGHAAVAAVSVVGSAVLATARGLLWGSRAFGHIMLAKAKEDTHFLGWLFRTKFAASDAAIVQEVRSEDVASQTALASKPEVNVVFHGRPYELCSMKVDADGCTFWGGTKEVIRLFYAPVDTDGGKELQARLETIAAFDKSKTACKVAARLELLVSSASLVREFELAADKFEMIPEPLPSEQSGGCGFISEEMMIELLGRFMGKRVCKRVSSIQVRMVSPRLGVFKGVLTKKVGIDRIGLPPSMQKVPASSHPCGEWAWLLVMRTCPSDSNLQIGKWVSGGSVCKSFRQKKFSPMLQRLLKSNGVPSPVVSCYAKGELRKEAWVMGVADPTGAVPAGHVFVSGLPETMIPCVNGQRFLFVTRSPCTSAEAGRLIPVVTQQPDGMTSRDWEMLSSRVFGDIVFPSLGVALPQALSEGDVDGDLYWVCWDAGIVQSMGPEAAEPVVADSHACSGKTEPLGGQWMSEARDYMRSGGTITTKRLIGKLYKAGEDVADKSEQGLRHPDAIAFFQAYAQAIDASKHGNCIDLPEHLRARVGL